MHPLTARRRATCHRSRSAFAACVTVMGRLNVVNFLAILDLQGSEKPNGHPVLPEAKRWWPLNVRVVGRKLVLTGKIRTPFASTSP
jgi:hypothetical protein